MGLHRSRYELPRRRERTAATYDGTPCRRGHSGQRYQSSNECVECAILRSARRYDVHGEQDRKLMREAYSADPAASRARVAARSAAHPDKLKAEKQREYARHADDYKARAQQRKLIIKQRSANLTAEHKLAINMLHARSRELTRKTGIPHEVDHIVPLCGENVSGLHVPWNLQILPRLDNRRKRNSLGNLSAREQLNDVRTQEQQPCP